MNTKTRPKTKAAKNVKAGDWVTWGRLAFLVGEDAHDNGDGTVFLSVGYLGETCRANERVTMHYED
ncbi:hypothetical protein SEA_SHAWTY_46 [Streptomyces phage Shawty]|uniref:Uncharacterized protein n=1 Tax=Streptomyces phage Shawty TaxID=2510521 RepID=A0A411CYI4_9CAUD|nr:hypothetical protein SEA_SHAWTY_46 [Streptomyces phage Shawty]